MINIYLGDSLEAMKGMGDDQYELAIVDPPYGIGTFSRVSNSGSYKKPYEGNNISYKYGSDSKWNDSTPGCEYFRQLSRVSKKSVTWGANYYNCFSSLGGALIWYKNPGLISQQSQCEIASLSWKKQVDYVHIKKLNGFINTEITYIHPCEKPIKLYKFLLKNYGFNKDGTKRTIFDSHGGSLSIVIACIEMGFDIDCWEIDKDYYSAAKKRIENHVSQLNAFREVPEINFIK